MFQTTSGAQSTRPALYASVLIHFAVMLAILAADFVIPPALQPVQVVHASGLETVWISPPLIQPPPDRHPAAAAVHHALPETGELRLVRRAPPEPVPFEPPRDIAALADLPMPGAPEISRFAFSEPALWANAPGVEDLAGLPPPPPPPAASQPEKSDVLEPPPAPIRIGGRVEPARIVKQVEPVYPSGARRAGVEGAVVLEAVINESGRLENVTVVSGHPMLVDAALECVRQWRYQPTRLNGVVVPSPIHIQVTFRLIR